MKKLNLFNLISIILFSMIVTSCNNMKNKTTTMNLNFEQGSFGYDLQFLQKHDSGLIVLKTADEKAKVIISAKYQSKVFTSTADGDSGKSFGWVNYKAFDGTPSTQMNAYGGENRFWLGPEGGKFSLYFNSGKEMAFPNWRTPAPIDTESWNVLSETESSVSLEKVMSIVNYKNSKLSIKVDRKITILNGKQMSKELSIDLTDSIKAVGYETDNKISNVGDFEWTEATGMPCIWMLDMFNPSPKTVIIIPFQQTDVKAFDKVATTNYFGEIPADRIKHTDKVLYFKADGKHRSKLGIKPEKILPFAGSYDADSKVLTIVKFDAKSDEKYLNQEWNTTKPSFSGDAMNAYNDGPLEDGTQMGPFYEIESVSPAAFLKPGSSLSHKHTVFHFSGSEKYLSIITEKVFGVSIEEIKTVF